MLGGEKSLMNYLKYINILYYSINWTDSHSLCCKNGAICHKAFFRRSCVITPLDYPVYLQLTQLKHITHFILQQFEDLWTLNKCFPVPYFYFKKIHHANVNSWQALVENCFNLQSAFIRCPHLSFLRRLEKTSWNRAPHICFQSLN